MNEQFCVSLIASRVSLVFILHLTSYFCAHTYIIRSHHKMQRFLHVFFLSFSCLQVNKNSCYSLLLSFFLCSVYSLKFCLLLFLSRFLTSSFVSFIRLWLLFSFFCRLFFNSFFIPLIVSHTLTASVVSFFRSLLKRQTETVNGTSIS